MFTTLCYLYYFDESRCSDFTWKGFFATIIIAVLWPLSCLIVLYYVLKNGMKLIKIKRKENYYGKKSTTHKLKTCGLAKAQVD